MSHLGLFILRGDNNNMPYIYHIVHKPSNRCYVGQSAANPDNLTRVWDHFNYIYHKKPGDNQTTRDMISSDGLSEFEIKIFEPVDNYGLNLSQPIQGNASPEMRQQQKGFDNLIDAFLSFFQPQGLRFSTQSFKIDSKDQVVTLTSLSGKTQKTSIEAIRLDVAEILHVVNASEYYSKVTNEDLGGEFAHWVFSATTNYVLNRNMSADQAKQVLSHVSASWKQLLQDIEDGVAAFLLQSTFYPDVIWKVIKGLAQVYAKKNKLSQKKAYSLAQQSIKMDLTTAHLKDLKNYIGMYLARSQIQMNFKSNKELTKTISAFVADVLSNQIPNLLKHANSLSSYQLTFWNGRKFTLPVHVLFALNHPTTSDWWRIAKLKPQNIITQDKLRDKSKEYFRYVYRKTKDPMFYTNRNTWIPSFAQSATTTNTRIGESSTSANTDGTSANTIGYVQVSSPDFLMNRMRNYYKDVLKANAVLFRGYNFERFYETMINNIYKSQLDIWKPVSNSDASNIWSGKDAYYTDKYSLPSSTNPNIILYPAYGFPINPATAKGRYSQLSVF